MDRNLSGHRIQAAVHARAKLTQDDLIARLQIEFNIELSKNTLSRMENGERYVTDVELVAISKVLNVSLAWLVEETNDYQEPKSNHLNRR